jgi:hypothetical protein
MNRIKYIGMDVHLATISIAVLDTTGKLLMEGTIATVAEALRHDSSVNRVFEKLQDAFGGSAQTA